MNGIILDQTSSLEKNLLSGEVRGGYMSATALLGEDFSYQITYRAVEEDSIMADVSVESPLAPFIKLYQVENVPAGLTANPGGWDDNYITTEPAMLPDLLVPLEDSVFITPYQNHALWVNVRTDASVLAGVYPITVCFSNQKKGVCQKTTFHLTVSSVEQPKGKRIFCQWIHLDCIADYYGVDVFSPEHWAWIERFVKSAAAHGINMLLTPVLTPPLDTEQGIERPTVQLLDVYQSGDSYTFGFKRLERYLDILKSAGIEYVEISHLFTQHGARFAPKVVAEVNGEQKRIFGWETPSSSVEYRSFLSQMIPALRKFLRERGVEDQTFFHISDEPGAEHLESYMEAKRSVAELLSGTKIIDALSAYEFYEKKLVEKPVVTTDHIRPFLEAGVQGLWCYTCCAQRVDVANRFIAMPSARSRILAHQMYRYDVEGYLHWGFNFYYSQWSHFMIDPFKTTDSAGMFPAGDPFIVYPGKTEPLPSLRLKVFHELIQDLAAFDLLEERIGREDTLKILLDGADALEFDRYPKDPAYILDVRRKVIARLEETGRK